MAAAISSARPVRPSGIDLQHLLLHLAGDRGRHVGVDEAGRDGVDRDVRDAYSRASVFARPRSAAFDAA